MVMIAFVPIPHSRPSKSKPRLYNRKSFRPLARSLAAFFFPLCCNLFARMGNPALRSPRDAFYDDRGDWIPHSRRAPRTARDNNIPTLLLFHRSENYTSFLLPPSPPLFDKLTRKYQCIGLCQLLPARLSPASPLVNSDLSLSSCIIEGE